VAVVGRFGDQLLLWAKPVHRKMRDQKIDLFLNFAGIPPFRGRLLDVGGGPGADGEFLRLYSNFAEVVLVNLNTHALEIPNGTSLQWVIADGCGLPFESRSFDWVFSNAVIEHVGDWERQRQFADEIRRVAAKGYFVATPNKLFPIEPHTLLPFYQFLPRELQRYFVRLSPGYMREPHQINLLSARDLHLLFQEARICKIGLRVFPNSLVAMHRVQS
jgi:ubiquinone/menaquinone biosynthesis C-methylase UbiE